MGGRSKGRPRVCPWWLGYLLLIPLRRRAQDPDAILGPYVHEGMTVLEVGPGMGYFTLPLARLVGARGRVVCADVETRMLAALKRRAAKAGLLDRIVPILAAEDALRLEAYEGRIDFALAFAVVHEVADLAGLMAQIHRAMRPRRAPPVLRAHGARLRRRVRRERRAGRGGRVRGSRRLGDQASPHGPPRAVTVTVGYPRSPGGSCSPSIPRRDSSSGTTSSRGLGLGIVTIAGSSASSPAAAELRRRQARAAAAAGGAAAAGA